MSAINSQADLSDFENKPQTVWSASTPPATAIDWAHMPKSEHFVQFYEEDAFLIQSVAAFVAAGLRQDQAAIVIATGAHREAIAQRLRAEAIDIEEAQKRGELFLLDAAETLAKFMVDGVPDERLFNHVVGKLVAQAVAGGRSLRAFGEMVALLWRDGNAQAAIQLEELWNELGKEHAFSLFCAYPMEGFCAEAHGKPFTHICNAHTRVIPAESYTATQTADERARNVTLLQQKAAALQAEISQRLEVEGALARREHELSDFLENATEGIHQVAPSGKILWANRAELELLGYTPGEYIGRDIRDFHADADVIADILNRLTRGEKLHDFEARLKHKDGSIRHVAINSSMYREGDRLLYSRCFTRDITERKRATELLEQTVAERTARLRETVSDLEAFSYSVSHDMRSPLRAMQAYARELLDDYSSILPEEGVETLERIERAANRLDMLVRDILAYSKVAKGETQLTPISTDALLNDVIEQHPDIHAQRQSITVQGPLPVVWAHQAYLSQCLTNLIANAIKFVEPGVRPRVQVYSDDCGEMVRICVADNGIGIAPEHRERIFQIFGRVYPEKRYPGTGIGLAIVKKAVARMGGETGFRSEVGKGSCFWFTLRRVNNEQ